MKKIISCSVFVAILFLSFSTMTFARGGKGNGRGCQNNTNQLISYVVTLKLTDDQVSKINVLIQKDNTVSKTFHDKIQTNFTALREMEWSKNFDKTKADKLLKEMSNAQASMKANHQKLNLDIRSLLTVDQQNLFTGIGGCINYGLCGGGCTRGQINSSSIPINFVAKLSLKDDQVGQIKALIQKDNTITIVLQDKIHNNFALLREMEWSKTFDKTKADKLLKEIDDAKNSMRTNHQKLNLDINSLLTPAQQKIFADLGGCLGLGLGNGIGCGRGGCPRG